MSYLFQVHGLFDDNDQMHLDYWATCTTHSTRRPRRTTFRCFQLPRISPRGSRPPGAPWPPIRGDGSDTLLQRREVQRARSAGRHGPG